MLSRRVAELLAPSRGMRIISLDRLDVPATLAAAPHCVGLAHAAAPLARLGSLVRSLVAQALALAASCPAHSLAPWHDACTRCESEPKCTELLVRADSWTVRFNGGTKTQTSAAKSLCVYCARHVYGISKTRKTAQLACAECERPMDALLYRVLSGALLADREADGRDGAGDPQPSLPFRADSLAERVHRDSVCNDAYLMHATVRLARTDVGAAPATLSSFARADTRRGCRPPLATRGVYDPLARGREARTGAPLRYEPARVELHSGSAVVTCEEAERLGLPVESLHAARSAKRRYGVAWESPCG